MPPIVQTVIHQIGVRPLVVSLLAQFVVLFVAVKGKDKVQIRQSIILSIGLALVIESINLRPPSPPDALPDWLGLLAAVLFVVPAVEAMKKQRKAKDTQEKGG